MISPTYEARPGTPDRGLGAGGHDGLAVGVTGPAAPAGGLGADTRGGRT
jgi:hypothetical protein